MSCQNHTLATYIVYSSHNSFICKSGWFISRMMTPGPVTGYTLMLLDVCQHSYKMVFSAWLYFFFITIFKSITSMTRIGVWGCTGQIFAIWTGDTPSNSSLKCYNGINFCPGQVCMGRKNTGVSAQSFCNLGDSPVPPFQPCYCSFICFSAEIPTAILYPSLSLFSFLHSMGFLYPAFVLLIYLCLSTFFLRNTSSPQAYPKYLPRDSFCLNPSWIPRSSLFK